MSVNLMVCHFRSEMWIKWNPTLKYVSISRVIDRFYLQLLLCYGWYIIIYFNFMHVFDLHPTKDWLKLDGNIFVCSVHFWWDFQEILQLFSLWIMIKLSNSFTILCSYHFLIDVIFYFIYVNLKRKGNHFVLFWNSLKNIICV